MGKAANRSSVGSSPSGIQLKTKKVVSSGEQVRWDFNATVTQKGKPSTKSGRIVLNKNSSVNIYSSTSTGGRMLIFSTSVNPSGKQVATKVGAEIFTAFLQR